MRCGTLASLAVVAALVFVGCTNAYGDEEVSAATVSAASTPTCSSRQVRASDTFEGRTTALDKGWAKGRVSDTLPAVTTPDPKTTAVLRARVNASTNDEHRATSYVEREIPTSGCIAAEFTVAFTEAAPFPEDAWTYFFWIDGSKDMNISMFREGKLVRLAAQRGAVELSRIDIDMKPGTWTQIKVEVEFDAQRPVMAVTVDKQPTQKVVLAEPIEPPYFMSFGTWARGAVPTHEFSYDDINIWY